MKLSGEALRIVRAKSFASVAMIAADGKPMISVVWIDERDGLLLFNTTIQRYKGKILDVGAPAAVCVIDPEDPYRYVSIRGPVARRTTEKADEDIHMLARKYRGGDFTIAPGTTRVTILVEPQRVFVYPDDVHA
ncbi:MAG: pyridoxamine 5'-phosphate oxidase family protein [Actinomycetota bacterium]